MPVVRSAESEDALIAAARLTAARGSTIVVVHVLEIPRERPMDADMGAIEDRARRLLEDAKALVEQYGVRVVAQLLRARSTPRAVVDTAAARKADLIVLGAPRRAGAATLLGPTARGVLRLSAVRVLVVAGRRAR